MNTLQAYDAQYGLTGLDKAVDWGWFEILSKPVFTLLDWYAGWLKRVSPALGMGLAILALTLTIRIVMFPFFNASYSMSTKMKKVQPEMKAIQERHKGDPQGQQKEMMALYAREKINPVTGCIPMLLPLPVFYALNNVFNVTIEMRQAGFGWVKDLSAPDPTTVWNLFGLLPWDPNTSSLVLAVEHIQWVGLDHRQPLPPGRLADHLRDHDVALDPDGAAGPRRRPHPDAANEVDAVGVHVRAGRERHRARDLPVVLVGLHDDAAVRADAALQGRQPDRRVLRAFYGAEDALSTSLSPGGLR